MVTKQAHLKSRDYITTEEFTNPEIETLLDVSCDLKRKFKNRIPTRYLADQTMFLMFFDKSTRTRNSFEAGMTQLGGHAHFLTADVMQVSHGESPKDTGIILSGYGHGIAIRHDLVPGEGNVYMREVAKWADAPVINMQCDVDHPCQTLADLMTIREKRGKNLRGLKIAVTWAYAPSYAKPLSVPQGLIMLMPRFGLDVTLAHPPEYNLMPETLEAACRNARDAGVQFKVTNDMDEAFRDADIVIPKSWGCLDTMGTRPEESLRIAKQYKSWICNSDRMKLAKPEALYMHPLPADRGNEVTDDVIDGPNSVVFDEANNRLHTAKSIMALTMSESPIAYEADELSERAMPATVVLALGGNAITRPGEPGTIPQQFQHTAESLRHLEPLFHTEARIVITHGNGPQIGNILIRVEEGERRVPRLPVDTCVADSQGGMGYMIQRLALEMFRRQRIPRDVVTLLTQVLVRPDDPAFLHPSKPVGRYYSAAELEAVQRDEPHYILQPVDHGRYRRVVPSPRPLQILETASVRALLDAGVVVIACGGGGIPVAWQDDHLVGIEGVVDKDLASCLLANALHARQFVIVTSVDQVAIRYGQPGERWLDTLTLHQAREYLAAGEFPPGSMGPKIEAAIAFLESGGEECIITSVERVGEALAGRAGTHLICGPRP